MVKSLTGGDCRKNKGRDIGRSRTGLVTSLAGAKDSDGALQAGESDEGAGLQVSERVEFQAKELESSFGVPV